LGHQHWLLKPLVGSPNLFELVIGEHGMLVVSNWNMHNAEAVRAVVGNQGLAKTFVASQLMLVKRGNDGSNAVA